MRFVSPGCVSVAMLSYLLMECTLICKLEIMWLKRIQVGISVELVFVLVSWLALTLRTLVCVCGGGGDHAPPFLFSHVEAHQSHYRIDLS